MTNRERAGKLLFTILKKITGQFKLYEDDRKALTSEIEQALSEPRPYFDGEFYHIPYYMQELSSKFMNEKVVPYAEVSEFVDDWNEYTLHAIGKRGFHFADELPGVFPFIAIPKETYERVMGEV